MFLKDFKTSKEKNLKVGDIMEMSLASIKVEEGKYGGKQVLLGFRCENGQFINKTINVTDVWINPSKYYQAPDSTKENFKPFPAELAKKRLEEQIKAYNAAETAGDEAARAAVVRELPFAYSGSGSMSGVDMLLDVIINIDQALECLGEVNFDTSMVGAKVINMTKADGSVVAIPAGKAYNPEDKLTGLPAPKLEFDIKGLGNLVKTVEKNMVGKPFRAVICGDYNKDGELVPAVIKSSVRWTESTSVDKDKSVLRFNEKYHIVARKKGNQPEVKKASDDANPF